MATLLCRKNVTKIKIWTMSDKIHIIRRKLYDCVQNNLSNRSKT